MSNIKKLIKQNLESLFETRDFEDMEKPFGVDKELSDDEKRQFGDMEQIQDKEGNMMPKSDHVGTKMAEKQGKESGKEATKYYKEVGNKMKKFQKPDQEQYEQSRIGEEIEKKVHREDSDDAEAYETEAYQTEAYGTGMQGLEYGNKDSKEYEELEVRMDNAHKGDPTYEKLKNAGKKYKKHKYEKPEEYHNTPKVRVEEMKYSDVQSENIFKANGKLINEEQVLKIANKVPNRVKVDETVFAITDGENSYRLIWEGNEDGEAVITYHKNTGKVNESIDKMKHLWNFDTRDPISTKKNITENGDDAFRRLLNQVRNNEDKK